MSTVTLAGSECAFNCHLLAPSPSSTVGPFFYSMEPPRASIIGWHGLWSSQRDERMEGGHRGPSVTSESTRRGAVEGVPAARGRRRRPGLQRRGAGPAGSWAQQVRARRRRQRQPPCPPPKTEGPGPSREPGGSGSESPRRGPRDSEPRVSRGESGGLSSMGFVQLEEPTRAAKQRW
jgi:hypothetical protein